MRMSRREFMRVAAAAVAAGHLAPAALAKLERALRRGDKPPVIWLQGAGCDGCAVSFLNSIHYAAVDDLLPEGYRTVGANLDVRHVAPTPVGFEVRARAKLIQVEGRQLTFRVQVYEQPFDEGTLVGEGAHQRVIIDVQQFSQRVAQKARANS